MKAMPGSTVLESFEREVNKVLNTARENAGKTATKSLSFTNNIIRMESAGSKGSSINISQVGTVCGVVVMAWLSTLLSYCSKL